MGHMTLIPLNLWYIALFLPSHSDRSQQTQVSQNIFNNLPALAPPQRMAAGDQLRLYLSTEVENVSNVLQWWYEKQKMYPRLHRMALDYLSIPGM